jgi:hypothetical protein
MGYRLNGILYEEGALPKQSYVDWDAKERPREPGYANLNGRMVRPPRGTSGFPQRAIDPSNIDPETRQIAEDVAAACAEELNISTPKIVWFGDDRSYDSRHLADMHPKGSTTFAEGPGARGFHSSSAPNEIWLHESVASDEGWLVRVVAHECYHASETKRLRAGSGHFKGVENEQAKADEFAEQIAAIWTDLDLPPADVTLEPGIAVGPSIRTNSF